MLQKLLVDGSEWKKNMLTFVKDLIKNHAEESDAGYILEVDVKYPKQLHEVTQQSTILTRKYDYL